MAKVIPIVLSRFAKTVEILSGSFTGTDLLVWFIHGVDLTNEGSEDNPPTLSYANIVDDSVTNNVTGQGDKIVNAFPSTFLTDTVVEVGDEEDRVSVKWVNRRVFV